MSGALRTVYVHTDTTDMWRWKMPADDPEQPHLLRVAVLDLQQDRPEAVIRIAWEPGWHIEEGAMARNHISDEYAATRGGPLEAVMRRILPGLETAERIVAYSSDFHRHVLERATVEAGLPWKVQKEAWFCAMRAATPFCRVPRPNGKGFATPRMSVAYQHFTGHPLDLDPDPMRAAAGLINAVVAIDEGITRATAAAAAA